MPDYLAWKRKLADDAKNQVFPLTLECELTSKCNFSCPMCFVKDNCPSSGWSFSEWKQLIDEAIIIGTLFFVLTGGEPLSNPSFWQIYEYLALKGTKVTIFTNGSLIDETVIQSFCQYPPELIVISLYGWNQQSVKYVTNTTNGFLKVDDAIDLLKKNHIPFTVRTLPIRPIYDGLDNLITYVKSKNLFLGYQLYLAPTPKAKDYSTLRLSALELSQFENKIRTSFQVYQQENCEISSPSSGCQAMTTGCYITHDGKIRPCALAFDYQKNYVPGQFLSDYQELAKQWHASNSDSECPDFCSLKR